MKTFAVIGAGVSGSFCAWELARASSVAVKVFEMGRGAGGRCSSRRTRELSGFYVDHGCPAFTAFGDRWRETVTELQAVGAIEEWDCSTGFIDAHARSSESAPCPPLFRGPQGMDSLCGHLLQDVDTNFSTAVQQVEYDGSEWLLYDGHAQEVGRADHLVVSSTAIACSLRWERIFGSSRAPMVELASKANNPALSACIGTLDAHGDTARPVFTLLMAFKRSGADDDWLRSLPFDLNVVKNHPDIAKVVRNRCATAEYDTVTIHSTHEFAQQAADVFGSKSSAASHQKASVEKQQKEAVLRERLMSGWSDLVSEWCPREHTAAPDWGPHLHRWGAAFSTTVLDEPVSVPSMRLSICGDFVGNNAGSVESAAMSGLDAARAALSLHNCKM